MNRALPFILGLPVCVSVILAERSFSLLRANFQLGLVLWVICAVFTLWMTLAIAAVVDRKRGDWFLWLVVFFVTIAVFLWIGGIHI